MVAPAIHYSVTILRHIEHAKARGKKLTAGQIAVLWVLWGELRNPFVDQPRVWASYGYLAQRTGLSESSVKQHTTALKNAGCLVKSKPTPRGIEYTLLRPEHAPEDTSLNPFDPVDAEVVAEAAVELLRKDNRLVKPRARLLRTERPAKPAIRPSQIAIALEDASGYTPTYATDDKGRQFRKAQLSFSAQCGEWSAVRAAQDFIAEHDWSTFRQVLASAKARGEWAPTKEQRARLFCDTKYVADLLASPTLTGTEDLRAAMLRERKGL